MNAELPFCSAAHEPPLMNVLQANAGKNATLKNNGHMIVVDGEFGVYHGGPRLGDMHARQLRFHVPSEHRVDGQKFHGEMQIVFANREREVLIIAVFLTAGSEKSRFLADLGVDGGTPLPVPKHTRHISAGRAAALDLFAAFGPQLRGPFYYYQGSETEPPCTEGVHWLVLGTAAEVSQEQVAALNRSFPHGNARTPQPINNRSVMLNLTVVYGTSQAPACPEVEVLNGTQEDGAQYTQPVYGCRKTCAVMDVIEDNMKKNKSRVKCPEACPIRAPCSSDNHLRCIVGGDQVAWMLQWTGAMASENANSTGLRDQCSFYSPLSQPNWKLKACTECLIPGCEVCTSTKEIQLCSRCLPGFEKTGDGSECQDEWEWLWLAFEEWVVAPLGVLIVLAVVLVVLLLWFAPVQDPEGTAWALLWAQSACPRDFRQGGCLFPRWRFWEWHYRRRSGGGLIRFFNYYVFVVASMLMFALLHWAFHIYNPQLEILTGAGFARSQGLDAQGLSRCPLGDASVREWLCNEDKYRHDFSLPLLQCSILTWASAVMLSALFAFAMEVLGASVWDERNEELLCNCVLRVDGLPRSLTTARHLEVWLEAVCEQVGFGSNDVVGASLCLSCASEVWERLDAIAEALVDLADSPEDAATRSRVNLGVAAQLMEAMEGSGCAYVAFRTSKCAEAVHEFLQEDHGQKRKRERLGSMSTRFISWLSDRSFANKTTAEAERALLDQSQSSSPEQSPQSPASVHSDVRYFKDSRSQQKYLLMASKVRYAPESINWFNFGMHEGEVSARVLHMPARIMRAILITVLFFLPSMLYFSKTARIYAAIDNKNYKKLKEGLPLMLKSRILAIIYGQSYTFVADVAINTGRSFGAVRKDGEDVVSLVLVVLSLLAILSVNVFFSILEMVPAYVDQMRIEGERPTQMDATSRHVFHLVFPFLLATRYVTEPFFSYWLPWLITRKVLPRLPYSICKLTPAMLGRWMRWPEIDPVWPYSDLIISSTLCIFPCFFITPYASKLFFYHALILIPRYFWLTGAWAVWSSQRTVESLHLHLTAMALWGLPTGVLAACTGFWFARHWEGLKLAPLDLPNGPLEWDGDATIRLYACMALFFCGHCLVYVLLVLVLAPRAGRAAAGCWGRLRGGRRLAALECEYTRAKRASPADFFNTNAPLVLASQCLFGRLAQQMGESAADGPAVSPRSTPKRRSPSSLIRRVKSCAALLPKLVRAQATPMMPYELGKEYQQGSHFGEVLSKHDLSGWMAVLPKSLSYESSEVELPPL